MRDAWLAWWKTWRWSGCEGGEGYVWMACGKGWCEYVYEREGGRGRKVESMKGN
jgi:hypothetical protein